MAESKTSKKAESKADTAMAAAESAENVSVATASETKKETEARMYVGASLPGLATYTVIIGKLTNAYENETVRRLMIPVSGMKEFVKKVKIEGSYENILYNKSVELEREMKNNGR